MVDEVKIVTPIGYLKTVITVENTVDPRTLTYIKTGIEIDKPGTNYYEKIYMPVGEERTTTLKEGLYKVNAFIGNLSSEGTNVEIKSGELASRIFHFGKESKK